MKVTVGVKALNEERHIGKSLASALSALGRLEGEVVLADSGSTDRTLEIAAALPVRVVQLRNVDERCCGAGAQLAFQHALGDYFYLLDGDMMLKPGFLDAGVAFLEANPTFAAVGGLVSEMNTEGEEFQIRAKSVRLGKNWQPGEVCQLDCGGLYRASAIRETGYFADRNLHAFEEFELGARLRAKGWKLARIDTPAVDHYGHQLGGYALLWRRLKSGYSGAPGEVLRSALGKPHLSLVLSGLSHVRVGLAVGVWWLLLLASLLAPLDAPIKLSLLAALLLAPLALLSARRGSLKLGLYSLVAWNVSAVGLFSGFFRQRTPPTERLETVAIQPPAT